MNVSYGRVVCVVRWCWRFAVWFVGCCLLIVVCRPSIVDLCLWFSLLLLVLCGLSFVVVRWCRLPFMIRCDLLCVRCVFCVLFVGCVFCPLCVDCVFFVLWLVV